MSKWSVIATNTIVEQFSVEIEAQTEERAWEIAENLNPNDWDNDGSTDDFCIESVEIVERG